MRIFANRMIQLSQKKDSSIKTKSIGFVLAKNSLNPTFTLLDQKKKQM
jgi:ABC-type lipoprotein export system ATPase subunit